MGKAAAEEPDHEEETEDASDPETDPEDGEPEEGNETSETEEAEDDPEDGGNVEGEDEAEEAEEEGEEEAEEFTEIPMGGWGQTIRGKKTKEGGVTLDAVGLERLQNTQRELAALRKRTAAQEIALKGAAKEPAGGKKAPAAEDGETEADEAAILDRLDKRGLDKETVKDLKRLLGRRKAERNEELEAVKAELGELKSAFGDDLERAEMRKAIADFRDPEADAKKLKRAEIDLIRAHVTTRLREYAAEGHDLRDDATFLRFQGPALAWAIARFKSEKNNPRPAGGKTPDAGKGAGKDGKKPFKPKPSDRKGGAPRGPDKDEENPNDPTTW